MNFLCAMPQGDRGGGRGKERGSGVCAPAGRNGVSFFFFGGDLLFAVVEFLFVDLPNAGREVETGCCR